MADYVDAGKVMLTPKGAWSIDVPYEKLDLVSRGTISYVGKKDSIGVDPATDTAEEYWQVFGSSLETDGITTELVNGKIAVKDYVSKTYVDQAIEEATPEDYDEVKAQVVSNARGINTLSETKADLATSGNSIQFDEDNSLLYLKNKSGQVISQTHIEAGGVSSIIHIDTHEDEWKANELVTVEIEDDTQTYQGHFDANGDYFHKVSTIGIHTVRVIDVDGQFYSSTVNVEVIGGVYYKFIDKTLPYMEWLIAGGLSRDAFGSLDEILADEVTVRRLMTIHASVDYMLEWMGKDADVYATFLASINALKWIGLRDYAYDHMPSEFISAWLNGDNWELALKDHVPTMTSDNAPYGASYANPTSTAGWRAFDNDASVNCVINQTSANGIIQYRFEKPINVRKFTISISWASKIRLLASNDGLTFTNLGDFLNPYYTTLAPITFDIENNGYYIIYRVQVIELASANYQNIGVLQFYGRSLNVSVPTMTSNTAPYGEVSASGHAAASVIEYKAFNAENYGWQPNSSGGWIQYDFEKKVNVKSIRAKALRSSGIIAISYNLVIKGTNDGVNFDDITSLALASMNTETFAFGNSNVGYKIIRAELSGSGLTAGEGLKLQFYGVDYSEREFTEGSTVKYLYDHGVELEEIHGYSFGQRGHKVEKRTESIYLEKVNGVMYGATALARGIDLTNYKNAFAIIHNMAYRSDSNTDCGQLRVCSSSDDYASITNYTHIGAKLIPFPLANKIISLDISSVNEIRDVGVYAGISDTDYNRYLDFDELWLE